MGWNFSTPPTHLLRGVELCRVAQLMSDLTLTGGRGSVVLTGKLYTMCPFGIAQVYALV